jgi:hypothetical protein
VDNEVDNNIGIVDKNVDNLQLLTYTEAAKLFDRTVPTLKTWVRKGFIKRYEFPNGKAGFRKDELMAYLYEEKPAPIRKQPAYLLGRRKKDVSDTKIDTKD